MAIFPSILIKLNEVVALGLQAPLPSWYLSQANQHPPLLTVTYSVLSVQNPHKFKKQLLYLETLIS